MGLYPFNPKMGQRIQTDAKGVTADIGYIAHITWLNPVAANPTRILAATAANNVAPASVITVFAGQPDVARQVQITPGGTTASVAAGNILVEGTDIAGAVITENVAIAAGATAAVFTTRAFKTVTRITFPLQTGAGATYTVGITDRLGLPYQLLHNSAMYTYLNDVLETVAPSVNTNATDYTRNLFKPNSALNGTKLDSYLIV